MKKLKAGEEFFHYSMIEIAGRTKGMELQLVERVIVGRIVSSPLRGPQKTLKYSKRLEYIRSERRSSLHAVNVERMISHSNSDDFFSPLPVLSACWLSECLSEKCIKKSLSYQLKVMGWPHLERQKQATIRHHDSQRDLITASIYVVFHLIGYPEAFNTNPASLPAFVEAIIIIINHFHRLQRLFNWD